MKIAVGTDDKVKIRKGHFGDSRYFLVFESQDGQIVNRNLVENPHSDFNEAGKVHHHGKAAGILGFLSDVQVFIGRSMGRHSVENLIKKGVTPLLAQMENAEEAVQAFLENRMEKFYSFDLEKKKFQPAVSKK